MRVPSSLIVGTCLGSILCSSLLLTGCVVPGYPYNGTIPYGALPPGTALAGAPVTAVAPGAVVSAPGASVMPYPYVYAPAPYLIAPTFYGGFGNGYWYGNRFWPYRPGCAFYGGRYYGGYARNYWHSGNGHWQGGYYHGGWNH